MHITVKQMKSKKLNPVARKLCIFLYYRYLVDSGIELDIGPDPALHLALRKGHSEIALMLLQAGAEFELKDSVSFLYIFNEKTTNYIDEIIVKINFSNWRSQ